MNAAQVSETDLHAYVDGALPADRVGAVESYLSEHPDAAARVSSYREQMALLHGAFDPVLGEPVPDELRVSRYPRRLMVQRIAAAIAVFAIGLAAGWQMRGYIGAQQVDTSTRWAQRAAIAHVVYSPEVRHAVEVGADQEAHLVRWLSKRLGASLKIPHLGSQGYSLVGGRLLPGDRGPVAQFMYQDGKGQRLTLYVRVSPDDSHETAFRYALENGVSVFYWIDNKLGYALSGEVKKDELLQIATAVYRQINP